MGLSNGERMDKMIWSIGYIFNQAMLLQQALEDPECIHYPTEETRVHLTRIIDGALSLWDLLYGRKGNASHWLVGSGVGDIVSDTVTDPWRVAIRDFLQNSHDQIERDEEGPEAERPFRPICDCLALLEVPTFIKQSTPWAYHFFSIYQGLEGLSYALRRYDDNFLSSFQALNKEVNTLMGLSYMVFAVNDIFARAYVLDLIVQDLYQNYDPWKTERHEEQVDIITNWLVISKMHLYLRDAIEQFNLNDLVRLHQDLLLDDDPDCRPITRMLTALTLSDREFSPSEKTSLLKFVDTHFPEHSREVSCKLDLCNKRAKERQNLRSDHIPSKEDNIANGYDSGCDTITTFRRRYRQRLWSDMMDE